MLLCHSIPPVFLHRTLFTWPFIVKTLLVWQASSGLEVESVLTGGSPRPGTGKSAFLFYDPFNPHVVGNHGPDAESDSAAGNVCAHTLMPLGYNFQPFLSQNFYLLFRKFSQLLKSFFFFTLHPRNLNICEIKIPFSSLSGSVFYYLIYAKLSQ